MSKNLLRPLIPDPSATQDHEADCEEAVFLYQELWPSGDWPEFPPKMNKLKKSGCYFKKFYIVTLY